MSNRIQQKKFDLVRVIKKLSLSGFVVITFIAYALQKTNSSDGKLSQTAPSTNGGISPQTSTSPTSAPPADQNFVSPVTAPSATDIPPTAPAAPAASLPNPAGQPGQYKDGTYTGPEVDALYGLVQVQTVIQKGKIVNVQFLEYPNDRRTSVRINSIAVPDLQQEAMQVQSANVDLITGATLTSEAFQMSLQGALDKAKG